MLGASQVRLWLSVLAHLRVYQAMLKPDPSVLVIVVSSDRCTIKWGYYDGERYGGSVQDFALGSLAT